MVSIEVTAPLMRYRELQLPKYAATVTVAVAVAKTDSRAGEPGQLVSCRNVKYCNTVTFTDMVCCWAWRGEIQVTLS